METRPSCCTILAVARLVVASSGARLAATLFCFHLCHLCVLFPSSVCCFSHPCVLFPSPLLLVLSHACALALIRVRSYTRTLHTLLLDWLVGQRHSECLRSLEAASSGQLNAGLFDVFDRCTRCRVPAFAQTFFFFLNNNNNNNNDNLLCLSLLFCCFAASKPGKKVVH